MTGLKEVFGSLTLGGYDAARFTPNNVSFDLAPDISRDLVVGLQSIITTESNGSTHLLLPSAHLSFIDSTIPYIYLPPAACKEFEKVFGLVWDDYYELYLVDDNLHQILKTRDPKFYFEIGNSEANGPTVEIMLPYSSFDLWYKDSFNATPVRYFPIQPAMKDSQLTLGRTFLQEAYLITNYEHANFSVSQCKFEQPLGQNIVPILPRNGSTSIGHLPSGLHLDRPETIGVSVSAVLGFLFLLAICYRLYTVRRRQNRGKMLKRPCDSLDSTAEAQHQCDATGSASAGCVDAGASHERCSHNNCHGRNRHPVPEIATNSWNFLREAPDNTRVELPEHRMTQESPRRSATPHQRFTNNSIATPLLDRQRRHTLNLSSSGLFSTASVARYWLNLNGLGKFEIAPVPSLKSVSTSSRLIQSYLDRSPPPTPTSETRQVPYDSAWTRVAALQHKEHEQEMHEPSPGPLVPHERSYKHRRGSF